MSVDDATGMNATASYAGCSLCSIRLVICRIIFAPGLAAAALDGALYALGGHDGVSSLSSVARYDPRLGAWSALAAPMRARRAGSAAARQAGSATRSRPSRRRMKMLFA